MKLVDTVIETLSKRRQAIVEHPFGIIKRQWGFFYISTKKGIDKAAADVGLIFTAYNLRRLFNILGKARLEALFATDFALIEIVRALRSSKKTFSTYLNQFYNFGQLVPEYSLSHKNWQ